MEGMSSTCHNGVAVEEQDSEVQVTSTEVKFVPILQNNGLCKPVEGNSQDTMAAEQDCTVTTATTTDLEVEESGMEVDSTTQRDHTGEENAPKNSNDDAGNDRLDSRVAIKLPGIGSSDSASTSQSSNDTPETEENIAAVNSSNVNVSSSNVSGINEVSSVSSGTCNEEILSQPDTTASTYFCTQNEVTESSQSGDDSDEWDNLVIVETPEKVSPEERLTEEGDNSEYNSGSIGQIKITCVQSIASDSTLFEKMEDGSKNPSEVQGSPDNTTAPQGEGQVESDVQNTGQDFVNVNPKNDTTSSVADVVMTEANVGSALEAENEDVAPEIIENQSTECEVSSSENIDDSDFQKGNEEIKDTSQEEKVIKTVEEMEVDQLQTQKQSTSDVKEFTISNNTVPLPISKETSSEKPETDKSKASNFTSKAFTFNIKKARTMLHSALGTTGASTVRRTESDSSGTSLDKSKNLQNSQDKSSNQSAPTSAVFGEGQESPCSQPLENSQVPQVVEKENFAMNISEPSTFLQKDRKEENIEESGDILDILKTHSGQNSPSPVQKEDSVSEKGQSSEKGQPKQMKAVVHQVARKSTTKKSPGLGKSPEKSESLSLPLVQVKQEPSDDYDVNVFSSMYKDARQILQTNSSDQAKTTAPKIVIENVECGTDSLAKLSSQVKCLPSASTRNLRKIEKKNIFPAYPTRVQSSSTMKINGIPSPAILHSSGPIAVAAPTKNMVGTSSASSADLVPIPIFLGPPSSHVGKTVTIKYNKPKDTTAGQTQKPPKIICPRPKVDVLSTAAVLHNNATVKLITPATLPVSSINIDTVGLPKITELIARKNPIPNYKPTAVPDRLKSVVTGSTYVCYECGDNFSFQSSWKHHRSRYSMKITYKCDDCKREKIFFNKCQFLSHLRQHLNIEKTMAVPIHIKSDSISILPLPKIYERLLFQSENPGLQSVITEDDKKKNMVNTTSTECSKRCRECGIVFPLNSLQSHFCGDNLNCDFRYCCSMCHLFLPSICSLRAHKRLHKSQPPLVCPECGENFVKPLSDDESNNSPETSLALHMITKCFHVNRVVVSNCPKCKMLLENNQSKGHLYENVDQYLKCLVCPMAFKSENAMQNHLETHRDEGKKIGNKQQFKMIYRCHLCDNVMDDLNIFEVHTMRHLVDMRKKAIFKFKCLHCSKEIFDTKELLKEHMELKHKNVDNISSECKKCMMSFSNVLELTSHNMIFHTKPTQYEFKPCKQCGRIFNAVDFIEHVCNEKKAQKVFDCYFCNVEIKTKSKLLKHMENHRKSGKLVCLKCYKIGFKNEYQLALHESACELEKPDPAYQCCGDCNKKFASVADLEKHLQKEHPSQLCKVFPCHLCEHAYQSKEELQRHVQVKHEAKRAFYPCDICKSRNIKKVFTSKIILEKHLTSRHRIGRSNIVHQEDSLSDNDTKEMLVDKDPDYESPPSVSSPTEMLLKRKSDELLIDRPIKRLHVEGEASFKCAKCDYSCDDRETFRKHLIVHKVDNNYIQCLECGLSFAVIPSLKKHLFMVHKIKDFEPYFKENGIVEIIEVDDDQEIRDVPPMPIQIKRLSSVEDEMSESEGSVIRNPLECRECHRTFATEAATNGHMRTHGMLFIRNKKRISKPVVTEDSSDSSLGSAPASISGRISE